MNANQLLQSKRQEIIQITARHGATNVRVFGSVARGEADAESDIDFLVTFGPGVSLLGHAALVRELESAGRAQERSGLSRNRPVETLWRECG